MSVYTNLYLKKKGDTAETSKVKGPIPQKSFCPRPWPPPGGLAVAGEVGVPAVRKPPGDPPHSERPRAAPSPRASCWSTRTGALRRHRRASWLPWLLRAERAGFREPSGPSAGREGEGGSGQRDGRRGRARRAGGGRGGGKGREGGGGPGRGAGPRARGQGGGMEASWMPATHAPLTRRPGHPAPPSPVARRRRQHPAGGDHARGRRGRRGLCAPAARWKRGAASYVNSLNTNTVSRL